VQQPRTPPPPFSWLQKGGLAPHWLSPLYLKPLLLLATGKLLFQPQYPFKAPGIMMLTPNGRFTTGSRLCLSMSDFHPESWNPLW